MVEIRRAALRVVFDRVTKLEFHGARVSSHAGSFPYRELDEAAQLTKRPDRSSRPPSWGRTRPPTPDVGDSKAERECLPD